MSDDDFEAEAAEAAEEVDAEAELEDLDELDGVIDDDDDVLDIDDVVVDEIVDVALEPDGVITALGAPEASTVATDEDDEEGLDLDEELHPDDVEAPLDALLQERTAKATLEDDEEEVEADEDDVDERGEGSTRIVPRRPGEFLCQSCFLVLPRHMLSDEARMLCQDCV